MYSLFLQQLELKFHRDYKMEHETQFTIRSAKIGKSRSKNKKKYRPPQKEQNKLSNAIYEKFLAILNKRRKHFLKQNLIQYYGKNFPINYKDHFRFEEQWENTRNVDWKDTENSINQFSYMDITLSFVTILAYFFTIWASTIDIFFNSGGKTIFYYEIYSISTVTAIINILLSYQRLKRDAENSFRLIDIIKFQYLSLTSILYFILKLAGVNGNTFFLWVLLEWIVLFFLYREAGKRYQSFRLMSFSLKYQYQTKVFDLIITIFIIAHFISIIIFCASKVNPDNNWMTPLNIDHEAYLSKYIYSFYFTTTTILTVGYGDLLPQNPFEVFVIIMVQIFGIAMLGYVINEIGYCISSLRKNRELIEKDLMTVEKMKKHYKMAPNLTNKIRSYLVNSNPDISQLSPEEEKGILLKVNEEIRSDMMKQNMRSIVKSSIFFICRWSNNFQHSISNKLIHVLFNPNDILYQPQDRERIYIVRSGKVSIHVSRIAGNKKFKNSLKTITNTVGQEVSDNCYGYTAAISTRAVRLFGISKEFTSAYYIDKQKFLDSVNEKILDVEHYHEIKGKVDQARFCESFEVPTFESSKQHYNPTKYYIIRRHCCGNQGRSTRKPFYRRDSQHFRGFKFVLGEEVLEQVRRCFQGSMSEYDTNIYEETEGGVRDSTVKRRTSDGDEDFCKFVMENNISANFHHYFESSKEYTNYFARCNKQYILKKMATENYVVRGKCSTNFDDTSYDV